MKLAVRVYHCSIRQFVPVGALALRGRCGVSPQKGSAETLGSAAGEGFPLPDHIIPNQRVIDSQMAGSELAASSATRSLRPFPCRNTLIQDCRSSPVENCQNIAYISDRRMAVQRLTEQILAHTKGLPEGAPIAAKSLLHLGNRAAVDQALSRLAERGRLMRAGRGVYLCPVSSRFGVRAPSVEKAVEALASQRGEVIVSNGAAAANALGLTTQVPVRSVYLTSGRSRTMNLGQQVVELRHAPRWQLALADRPAGQAVRALAWLGPEKAEAALKTLKRKLPSSTFGELVAAAPQLPSWLARTVGKVAHG